MKIKLSEKAKDAAYVMLPEHMSQHVIDYFEQGYPPGSFLRAVLENDLMEAFVHADDINSHHIKNYMEWLRWHVPGRPDRWGSREAVQKHIRECYEQNEKGEAA